MLKLESLFWTAPNADELSRKLMRLGFEISESTREPSGQEIFFGPDSIELLSTSARSAVFDDSFKQITQDIPGGNGICAVALESDHLLSDFKRLESLGPIEKIKKAENSQSHEPIWYGAPLSEQTAPVLRGWLVMHSPAIHRKYEAADGPMKHPNTCWGIEGIHLVVANPEATSAKWAQVSELPTEGLHWNELSRTSGRRIRTGDKFLDFLKMDKSDSVISKATGGREGVFMLTLKMTDVESYKAYLLKNKIPFQPCHTRDGLIIPSSETGGPILRFVRQFWQRYAPVPELGRKVDHFHALGGAYVSTLEEGFSYKEFKYGAAKPSGS